PATIATPHRATSDQEKKFCGVAGLVYGCVCGADARGLPAWGFTLAVRTEVDARGLPAWSFTLAV
ncbi:MAG TPA: hypothetical protein PK867_09505, partial [Pirellulales bacterium]|nr:hypothetical protein [Pirellulales bacterium]